MSEFDAMMDNSRAFAIRFFDQQGMAEYVPPANRVLIEVWLARAWAEGYVAHMGIQTPAGGTS